MIPKTDPHWLAAHLGAPGLRILDVRSKARYLRGHVPGAVLLDVESTWFDDVSAPELALVMSTLGVGDGHTVVLIDEATSSAAATVARALRRYGHLDVHVLDGGWQRWLATGGAIARDFVRHSPASFTARVA